MPINKIKELLGITAIPVFIASLCCLTPVILVFLGFSTVAFAASLTDILYGQYTWVFRGVGVLALIVSLVFYYRKKGICTLDQVKKHRNEILNKSLIVFIMAILFYIVFFKGVVHWAGAALGIWGW